MRSCLEEMKSKIRIANRMMSTMMWMICSKNIKVQLDRVIEKKKIIITRHRNDEITRVTSQIYGYLWSVIHTWTWPNSKTEFKKEKTIARSVPWKIDLRHQTVEIKFSFLSKWAILWQWITLLFFLFIQHLHEKYLAERINI